MKKVNPFKVESKEIVVENIKLNLTLPSTKKYMQILDKNKGNENQLAIDLITECITFDGDTLDVEALPIKVFTELSKIVINEFNPDMEVVDEDKKK